MLWLCAWYDINVEFPAWVNSKCAIEEFGEVFEHFVQVFLLGCAEVCTLFDNLCDAHLLILGILDFGGIAVWIIPVPVKELFIFAMYFKGFSHSEIIVVIQIRWNLHWQLTIKPFYGSRAVLNIDATLCKEVGT